MHTKTSNANGFENFEIVFIVNLRTYVVLVTLMIGWIEQLQYLHFDNLAKVKMQFVFMVLEDWGVNWLRNQDWRLLLLVSWKPLELKWNESNAFLKRAVQDDSKLPGDTREVPIYEWSNWQFDSGCEIFSLLDEKN